MASFHLHLPGVTSLDIGELFGARRLLRKIFCNTERIIKMSGTLAEQLAAAQAETSAKLDTIGTDVTEIGADVDQLLAGMNPGDAVTQSMVDNATSIRDRMTALQSGLAAINAKVPPVTPTP